MLLLTSSKNGEAMQRHIKAQPNGKVRQVVAPGTMRFLDFARLLLRRNERHAGETPGRECVLDVFSGAARVSVETEGKPRVFEEVGGRPDVFSGQPVMVYFPPASLYEITAITESFDAGLFSAPSKAAAEAKLLEGPAVSAKQAGRDNWQRTVYSALDERVPAERLLAGETLNPPGNWSSYPPHKHDRKNPPSEAVLEEIYFFRVKPEQGYGFIWTYTAPGDPDGFSTVFVVEDGDTVLLPKGYHPVVAAPGYALHYTWVLAGEERRYGAWADDPRHEWVKNQ
jgi:5-deoxy-glucuronate isomerase